jgi:hypothetical protein
MSNDLPEEPTKGLTTAQRQAMHDQMEQLGLSPADIYPSMNTGDFGGNMVLSANPNESHLPPSGWVMAKDINHLKAQVGVKNEDIDNGTIADDHIEYPPEASDNLKSLCASCKDGCELERQLKETHLEDKDHLAAARLAYVQGHSDKVKSYEEAINKVSFPKPMTIPVFAADNLTVGAGETKTFKGTGDEPLILNFGTVTVGVGGQIAFEGGAVKWTSQVFTQLT